MRSFLSVVCGVAAFFLALLTIPTAWVAANVADEDGYVELSRSVVEDADFRSALSGYLGGELVSRAGLPDVARPPISAAIERATGEIAGSPEVLAAAEESQRRSHRLMFEGEGTDGRLALDLAPIAALVTDRAGGIVPTPESLVITSQAGPTAQLIDAVDSTPAASRAGIIVISLLCLATVALASRRAAALAWLGGGAVAAAALIKAGSWLIAERTVAGTSDSLEAALVESLTALGTASLDRWLLVIAAGGAVAIVLGGLGSAIRR